MDEFAEINVTPLTDVLLVLLIIFMVMAALVAPAGFEKRVACHCLQAKPSAPPFEASLVVARNGRMALDGRPVDQKSIYPAMRMLRATHAHVAISIFAMPTVPYQLIVRAMDAAKEAHIADVSFVSS